MAVVSSGDYLGVSSGLLFDPRHSLSAKSRALGGHCAIHIGQASMRNVAHSLLLSFYLRDEQILIDIGNMTVGSSYPFHHIQLVLPQRTFN